MKKLIKKTIKNTNAIKGGTDGNKPKRRNHHVSIILDTKEED